MSLLRTAAVAVFPRRFVQHSLATNLAGPMAIEPRPLRLAVDEARSRLDATPASEIRALVTRPAAERLALATRLEPMTPATAPAPMPTSSAAEAAPATYCACIPISGVLIRGDASCARFLGLDATGLEEIECALQEAAADPTVAEICLEVCSPGGVASGIQELVELIGAIQATKPVRAEVSGLCASAAYWLVSGCTEIKAEPSALVGSIGVFAVVEDSSKAAAAAGCVVHVLRSGPHKGVGVEGAAINSEQLAELQRRVDVLATLFVDAIAAGRELSTDAARALATGQEWIASEAVANGLIDGILGPELDALAGPSLSPESPSTDPAAPAATGTLAREGGLTPPAIAGAVQEDIVNEKDFAALADRMSKLEASSAALQAENQGLKAKNQELEAESRARAAALAETTKARKAAVIESGVQAGRIVGDMLAEVKAYGDAIGDDVGKLERFVAALPVQTRPTALGGTPTQAGSGTGAITAEDRKIMAAFGVTEEQMAAADKVTHISLDGRNGVTAEGERIQLVKS